MNGTINPLNRCLRSLDVSIIDLEMTTFGSRNYTNWKLSQSFSVSSVFCFCHSVLISISILQQSLHQTFLIVSFVNIRKQTFNVCIFFFCFRFFNYLCQGLRLDSARLTKNKKHRKEVAAVIRHRWFPNGRTGRRSNGNENNEKRCIAAVGPTVNIQIDPNQTIT